MTEFERWTVEIEKKRAQAWEQALRPFHRASQGHRKTGAARAFSLALGAVGVALGLAGCTVSANDTNFAAETMGLRDLKLGGPSLFGCSDRDTFTRTFTATAANGQRVKGVVCKGWLKGATIRITGRA